MIIMAQLEKRGLPRRACVRKLTDQDVQAAARFYAAGESLKTVGQRFGVNDNTILNGVVSLKNPALAWM